MSRDQQIRSLATAEAQLHVAVDMLEAARLKIGFLPSTLHDRIAAPIASAIATARTSLHAVMDQLEAYQAGG